MLKSLEEIFRENLIRLRGRRTQAEIAEMAGIPLRSYSNSEVNGSIPQGPNRAAIANALGVQESHLFVDREEFSPRAGISPEEAWEIVGKALAEKARPNTPTLVPTPAEDPEIRELIGLISGNTFAIEHLTKAARALLGKPALNKTKVHGE